ncbi:hypothetical protein FO519_009271 [Halicephalobus sp. NKZ332]|nr:hypothetical protein FO519_009271 [Halicephalobus sp. NKZ332]
MSKKALIDFYFDIISPYSYIGFEAMLRYKSVLPVEVKFKPFFVAGVMAASGNTSPAYNKPKERYSRNDIQKMNEYWGLNLSFPEGYITNFMRYGSLLPQRFLTAVEQKQPDYLVEAARAFSRRIFVEHLPVHTIDDVEKVGLRIKLPEIGKILEFSQTPEIKDLLKERTNEALESGAFGAPWIILKQEGKKDSVFFGGDRFPLICSELGIDFKGPLKSTL